MPDLIQSACHIITNLLKTLMMLNRVPVMVMTTDENSKPREPNGGTGTQARVSRVILLSLCKAASHKGKLLGSLLAPGRHLVNPQTRHIITIIGSPHRFLARYFVQGGLINLC